MHEYSAIHFHKRKHKKPFPNRNRTLSVIHTQNLTERAVLNRWWRHACKNTIRQTDWL